MPVDRPSIDSTALKKMGAESETVTAGKGKPRTGKGHACPVAQGGHSRVSNCWNQCRRQAMHFRLASAANEQAIITTLKKYFVAACRRLRPASRFVSESAG
jgi:hypothetical protein